LKRIDGLRRLALAGALASGGTAFGLLDIGHAHAGYSICRTDPIFTLSNGVQVTMSDDITDTAADVKQITYTLNVPKGVTLQSTLYTSWAGNKEIVKFSANNAAHTYSTSNYVITYAKGMPVTATMSVSSSTLGTWVTKSLAGVSGGTQSLVLTY
jgi:hypothetical protein